MARTKRGARGAERPGDDEQVPRPCAGTPRDAICSSEGGNAEQHRLRASRVAATHWNTRLVQSLVQLDNVGDLRLAGQSDSDDQRERIGAARGEIAQIDRHSTEAEVAPGNEIETKVHALDQ